HPELGVDVRQVARDRPLAEKQRRGDLPVRTALCDQACDAALGCGQPFRARPPADAPELRMRLLDPAGRAELLETGERGADRVTRRAFLPGAPQNDSERQQRSRPTEAVFDLLVLRHCEPEK